jgi:hypothetical protein
MVTNRALRRIVQESSAAKASLIAEEEGALAELDAEVTRFGAVTIAGVHPNFRPRLSNALHPSEGAGTVGADRSGSFAARVSFETQRLTNLREAMKRLEG